MKRLILAGMLLAAAPLSYAAAQNWNDTFAQTEAGHRVGNPDAATKLIEFVSYTCPHCATFEKTADGPLRIGFIHDGSVEVEVRHVIRNPVDLAAVLATECGDPQAFFGNHRRMLHTQDDWLAKARAATPAQQQRWSSGPVGQRMRAIASDLGFYDLMAPRGLTVSELDQCLNDEARAQAIVDLSNASSQQFGVPGTPSFAVNGQLLEGVHTWDALEPALKSAREGS